MNELWDLEQVIASLSLDFLTGSLRRKKKIMSIKILYKKAYTNVSLASLGKWLPSNTFGNRACWNEVGRRVEVQKGLSLSVLV